jgi:hypothetical protein
MIITQYLAGGEGHASWRKQMKSLSVKMFATLVLASALSLGTGLAQTQSDKEPPKTVSIRGCLVKGDEPQEVWLAEKSGKIYGLESSKIDLNEHLGHKVIVRGYLLSQGKGAHEAAQKQDNTVKPERADFRVLTLKMISATCL